MRAMSSFIVGAALAACASEPPPQPTSVQATVGADVQEVAGTTSCADLGYAYGVKIDPPQSGTYALDANHSVTVTTADGVYFDWTATLGIDKVIVKGGLDANVYGYDPEATSGTALSSPINDSTCEPYTLSHIEFCFDYEVAVTKTANASLARTWRWNIEKSAPATDLVLAAGQTYLMPYSVTVNRGAPVDGDWAIAGAITITNPAPFAATLTAVTDTLGGTPIAVDCGVTFPYTLAAGATLACTYATAVSDGTDRVNTVEVATTGAVGPGSASATALFGTATVTERDACADVSDDQAGSLGTVCDTTSFEYSLQIGPYAECGTNHTFVNVASFVTCDTGETGSAGWTVNIAVPACDTGCTLTPGYWKTHSSHGPAPYDDTWAQLVSGADTAFFLSGKTFYEVLWTPSSQGAYYTLAHAYIAAQLNRMNGAGTAAIQTVLDDATAIFTTYTPAQIAALGKSSALRTRVLDDAAALDAYNNGLTGPGHCTE